ncbi:hypothetical protein B0T10DRAFT_561255 [Thelonectria olida]|uniref:Uncharacterized protein n=1 Tax=Thelonectria olida TaxID=1576542 RepID=A0A9P9AM14_9HYPO|nr:hypothetical protein B0T10DRAFT_561255 [Thelonectria olida]
MGHHKKCECGSRTATTIPEPQVETVCFECILPAEESALKRITTPLPFSKKVTENLAWAAAFIDRAGHLTQDYELLEKRLHAAIDTIGNDAIEMTLLREQLHAQAHVVERLEVTVAGQEKVNKELEQRLAKSRAAAAKAEKDLVRKLRNSEKALQRSKTAESRLKDKLDKTLLEEHERWLQEMEHEREDHASIDSAHDALERALQEKAAIQAELDAKSQELTSTQHELDAAKEQLSACKKNCENKEAEIKTLTEQLATANRTNTELSGNLDAANSQLAAKEQEVADVTKALGDVTKDLAEANEKITQKDSTISNLEASLADANGKIAEKDASISTLEANLAATTEDRDQKAKLLEDLQKATEETHKALQDKIDELSAHDLEDHQRLQAAEEAKRISDQSIKDLQEKLDAANAHDAEDHQRLQAEEEAKRAAEAELERVKLQLEEANKPKLPNTVTLSNPIPIVGSLGGASDNFDDIFYPIVSSFPITLYGHSSTQVFVNINGTFTLDRGDASYTYQPLPCRNMNLPDYTLFPFWCDLYIYKDTPQGIYYEIAGQAPSRTLCVEWYVSRYGDQTQYYHFNMLLEEARPNIVTYKYYEALDKGGACTIGAQGPNSAQMWSYKQQKALPGVQVVIDTSSGSVTESTFPLPQ